MQIGRTNLSGAQLSCDGLRGLAVLRTRGRFQKYFKLPQLDVQSDESEAQTVQCRTNLQSFGDDFRFSIHAR